MARKLAFINYKGGVGKTSLTVNVAACLAHFGHRVLVVDLDAQSNSSVWLLRLDRWNQVAMGQSKSLINIFMPGDTTLRECRQRSVVRDRDDQILLEKLDLIPTTFEFIDLEHEYQPDPQNPYYLHFAQQILDIEEDYDYILYDCPPNLLRGSECAIFAANEIYIPCNPDALSLIGFTLLTNKINEFQQRTRECRPDELGTHARVQGLILNSIKTGVNIDVPRLRLQSRLNQFKSQRRVALSAEIFEETVRDAIIVRRAVTLGLPLVLVGTKEGSDAVLDDYLALTKRLVQHGQLIKT